MTSRAEIAERVDELSRLHSGRRFAEAVQAYFLTLDEQGREAFIYAFGLVPAFFSVINVFTSMFVHGGIAHLAGNMLFLWIFGDNVEDRLGHGRFLMFYLLCGFAAAVSQAMLNPGSLVPMVGASGAIAGVMGAYLVLYPRSRVRCYFPVPAICSSCRRVFFLVMVVPRPVPNCVTSCRSSSGMRSQAAVRLRT